MGESRPCAGSSSPRERCSQELLCLLRMSSSHLGADFALEQMRDTWIICAASSASAAPPAVLSAMVAPSQPLSLLGTFPPRVPLLPLHHLNPALPKELMRSVKSSHKTAQRSIFLAGGWRKKTSDTNVPHFFWCGRLSKGANTTRTPVSCTVQHKRDCGTHAPNYRFPCQAEMRPSFCSVP